MMGTKTEKWTKDGALALGLLVAAFMAVWLLLLAVGPAYTATTFFVNSTKDRADENPGNGQCSTGVRIVHSDGGIELECTLRAAIQESNALAGTDAINFGILSTEDSNCDATTNVCTISPPSSLPTIVRPLTINGYSQPGSSVNTATVGTNAALKIVLDGSNFGSPISDGLFVTAPNTTVKGLVINNFRRFGVVFDEVTPSDQGRTLEGCFIGTDASGTLDRGNGGGVIFDDGEGNVIGGTTLAARNLVSGNDTGVRLSPANANSIQGNLIGTKKDGITALGNRTGVHIVGGSNNTIGGNGAASNTIAFNGFHGVQVQEGIDPNSGTGNRILGNSIHDNDGLGIELGADGVTPNDPRDPDTGANTLQNKPRLDSAATIGAATTISGALNSTPDRNFVLRFFSNPSGNEGETFIGQATVTTNANGNVRFTFSPAQRVALGQRITATATGPGGNTSEFSAPRTVESGVIG